MFVEQKTAKLSIKTKDTRIKMCKTTAVVTLLYGSESWTLIKRQESQWK